MGHIYPISCHHVAGFIRSVVLSNDTSLTVDSIAAKCQKGNVIAEREKEKHND